MQSQETDQAIGAILARLWLHYPNPDYSPQHWRALTEDYVEELRRYPLEVISEGAKACRRKLRFRPTIAEMIAEIVPRLAPLRPVSVMPQPMIVAPLSPEERARRLNLANAMPNGPAKRFAMIAARGEGQ